MRPLPLLKNKNTNYHHSEKSMTLQNVIYNDFYSKFKEKGNCLKKLKKILYDRC